MSLQVWGVILIGLGLLIAVIGWYRLAITEEIQRIKRTVTFVEPADPQVRIYVSGGIYDWDEKGDL